MRLILMLAVLTVTVVPPADAASTGAAFPDTQPQNGNFNRPSPGQVLDVSPPGFCWWRAGARDEVFYRLRITDAAGEEVYRSGALRDPVHVPSRELPAGEYAWAVDALDAAGDVLATRASQPFTMVGDALALPWVEPRVLLARVDREHPRLLFPAATLPEVRATLDTTRREAFEELRQRADAALELPLMDKPDFDRFDRETEYPARRTAYRAAYHEFTRVYHGGMTPMALMYLLTGERVYGERAKAHLLNLLDWETDGIASLEEGFDEIGLRIARTAPQAYDWLHDLLTEQERQAVRAMLIDHGNQMLARLERRDFLNDSAYSHDGRLPGYLVEFSIALAEEPEAQLWMDYAMRALLTVFPHWAGQDGGWAEGANYCLSYNDRFITPLHSLDAATGYDLWRKSYFRHMRHFLVYGVAPNGEVMPFGDGEAGPVPPRAGAMRSILHYHALRYRDPVTRWWIDQEPMASATSARTGPLLRLILPDDLPPAAPVDAAPDRAFRGIGWAALHTDLTRPGDDLMVLFKSSPYGSVSHGHAAQNNFVIMKGGKALAIPAGERYPQHHAPFHTQYTQQTIAHNCLLIDGQGQRNQDNTAVGRLTAFESHPHVAYVAGEAAAAYGDVLDRYTRHVVLIRPSIILILDDVEAPRPVRIDWLMHAFDRMQIDQDKQVFTSVRADEQMRVHLFGTAGFDFEQTDAWPLPPKTDYPMATAPEPEPQWHLTASARGQAARSRIAAVMLVAQDGAYPDCGVEQPDAHTVRVHGQQNDVRFTATIDLMPDRPDDQPMAIIEVHEPGTAVESLEIQ